MFNFDKYFEENHTQPKHRKIIVEKYFNMLVAKNFQPERAFKFAEFRSDLDSLKYDYPEEYLEVLDILGLTDLKVKKS